MDGVLNVLSQLGVLPYIQLGVIIVTALMVYRYFTDR